MSQRTSQEATRCNFPEETKVRYLSVDEMFVQNYGTKEQLRKLVAQNNKGYAQKVRDILRAAGCTE